MSITLYTVKEAAEKLGVNEDTINRWRRIGRLGCVTTGPRYVRFTEAHINAFIFENSVSAGRQRCIRTRR
jgi:excisionase family DNA binding protein